MIRAPLTYCSFTTEAGCLGVLVLEGDLGPEQAVRKAWRLGLNPGGQVLTVVLPLDIPEKNYLQCFENRHRLLAPEEARELLKGKPIREWEEAEADVAGAQ